MNNKTVLLVDDEPILLKLGERMFSRLGFKIYLASDGAVALDLLEIHNEEIDLVVTDMNMPHFSGIQIAEIINEKWPSIKLVMLSGFGDELRDIIEDSNVEPIQLLSKPFQMKDIEELIADIFTSSE